MFKKLALAICAATFLSGSAFATTSQDWVNYVQIKCNKDMTSFLFYPDGHQEKFASCVQAFNTVMRLYNVYDNSRLSKSETQTSDGILYTISISATS